MVDPETVQKTSEAAEWLGKIGALFGGAVMGFAAAVWAVASKVNGYDSRLKALEEDKERRDKSIDRKLDRLHERIDEILLTSGMPNARRMVRGSGADEH